MKIDMLNSQMGGSNERNTIIKVFKFNKILVLSSIVNCHCQKTVVLTIILTDKTTFFTCRRLSSHHPLGDDDDNDNEKVVGV